MHRTAATASMLVRVCFSGAACLSAPLDPNDFTSLGVLPAGDLVIDTEGLTFGGMAGGVLHVQGGGAPDIAVYTFDGGSTLAEGDAITVTGGNALALLFRGSATLSGTIDVSGANGVDAVQNVETGIGGVGVAGGGRGGNGGPFSANQDGVGPGHGVVGSNSASVSGVGSGSGGGFGTMGGQGGVAVTFRPGGSAYGAPLRDLLHAGSGGGGGGGQGVTRYGGGGGAGGGALEIGATSSLMFAGGALLANGGNGGEGFADGGGGSGGGVLLHAPVIQLDAATLIQANGGHGGISGLGGNTVNVGGCGGAGRVEIVYGLGGSISDLATIEVNAGPFQGDCTDGEPVVVEAVVPEPSGLVLLLLAAAARTSAMRRTQESRRNAYQ